LESKQYYSMCFREILCQESVSRTQGTEFDTLILHFLEIREREHLEEEFSALNSHLGFSRRP
jgi:hypothetical protein